MSDKRQKQLTKKYKDNDRGNMFQRFWANIYPYNSCCCKNYGIIFAPPFEREFILKQCFHLLEDICLEGGVIQDCGFSAAVLKSNLHLSITSMFPKRLFLPVPMWMIGNAIIDLAIHRGHYEQSVDRILSRQESFEESRLYNACCLKNLEKKKVVD